jgi:hypothetical protein
VLDQRMALIVEFACNFVDGSCPNVLSVLRSYRTLDLKGVETPSPCSSEVVLVICSGPAVCLFSD